MSVMLRMTGARLAFGTAPVLENADLTIRAQERVCITGRNGAGKSSLLKVLNQDILLDEGELHFVGEASVAMLPQDPPERMEGRVYDYVAGAFAEVGALLSQFQQLSHRLAEFPEDQDTLNTLMRVQQQLDVRDGWKIQTHIEHVLSRLQLDGEQSMASLSGGWLRRAALARAMALNPDILLLDEPTNHLDMDTVVWLESMLREFRGALVFISHDRAFIRALATRIIDLDRGVLTSFPGDYAAYLVEKQRLLEVEEAQAAEFDKKLAQEETWIRQGIKARRTRNEGRVRALKALRQERAARRVRQGNVSIEVGAGERSGKVVFEGTQLNLTLGEKTLIRDLDVLIQRGDKVAFVGPNGCGKSSLIRLITGELQPTSGLIKLGTNLNIAYFDQHRQQLDLNRTIADNVGEGKTDVTHQGRTRHIYSYLQDFLFTPQQARMPVSALSGGEKNRVLLAKILLKESNLLILDEPTNDLDIDTLELLEQVVVDYPGTVLMVSHDREFIDNAATTVLLFEGQGQVTEIVGGFNEVAFYLQGKERVLESHHVERSTERPTNPTKEGTSGPSKDSEDQSSLARKPNKLSYKLKRELEQLPQQIEVLEAELNELQQQINDPEFFRRPVSETKPATDRITELENALNEALERWDYLENLQGN
ncbi:ATP-binding cassette domain-containing protein [Aliidiomarina sanyensis]|uniref:ATP-binding protein Uup n=1 Tax=Aliidiomarina sanyensis TaxID=1249555 RepID=A0A432WRU5_9GAMM|nr:ATP-binding cassette domain-containing protein [Aliidiomarina sanyensis]RUO36488.1 ABC transporter ATP-binding protein [Aliidiomarina sanyensis]